MRPILCLFLIGLAVHCYEANDGGVVCKAVLKDLMLLLLGSKESLEEDLKSYNPPQEVIDAKMLVKECVDKISLGDQFKISISLTKILRECDMKAWLSKRLPNLLIVPELGK